MDASGTILGLQRMEVRYVIAIITAVVASSKFSSNEGDGRAIWSTDSAGEK